MNMSYRLDRHYHFLFLKAFSQTQNRTPLHFCTEQETTDNPPLNFQFPCYGKV